MLTEALEGLDYLHGNGVLHGNIKPTNLLLDVRGRVRRCDGLGVLLNQTGDLPPPSGSHKYLAPEMLEESLGEVGVASDLYCLGMVALERLLGSNFNSHFQGVGPEAVDPETGWISWHTSQSELPRDYATCFLQLPRRWAPCSSDCWQNRFCSVTTVLPKCSTS